MKSSLILTCMFFDRAMPTSHTLGFELCTTLRNKGAFFGTLSPPPLPLLVLVRQHRISQLNQHRLMREGPPYLTTHLPGRDT